jgi:enoyl-CoA hydratase/carnithine racemase
VGVDKTFSEARDILVNILEMQQPIMSAVNGPAAGLGVILALFPDIVIASDRPKPGEVIEAQEAFRIGLVNHLAPHDELDKKIMDMA